VHPRENAGYAYEFESAIFAMAAATLDKKLISRCIEREREFEREPEFTFAKNCNE